jgi:hypothetical protein
MGAGRPTKYKKEYCELIIEHMAQGLSKMSFAAVVGCGVRTIYEWEEAHEEFSHAIKEGEALSMMHFEKVIQSHRLGTPLIEGLDLENSKPSCAIFPLKTRHHKYYGDKSKVDLSNEDGSMKPAQVTITIPSNGKEVKEDEN